MPLWFHLTKLKSEYKHVNDSRRIGEENWNVKYYQTDSESFSWPPTFSPIYPSLDFRLQVTWRQSSGSRESLTSGWNTRKKGFLKRRKSGENPLYFFFPLLSWTPIPRQFQGSSGSNSDSGDSGDGKCLKFWGRRIFLFDRSWTWRWCCGNVWPTPLSLMREAWEWFWLHMGKMHYCPANDNEKRGILTNIL